MHKASSPVMHSMQIKLNGTKAAENLSPIVHSMLVKVQIHLSNRQAIVILTGNVLGGLTCDPSGDRAYYPLGSSIVVRHIGSGGEQKFLTGKPFCKV